MMPNKTHAYKKRGIIPLFLYNSANYFFFV
nr:MAG TPA: hypothetical protein [Caudoviricetes sp.]